MNPTRNRALSSARALLVLGFSLALAACGGGGGGDADPSMPTSGNPSGNTTTAILTGTAATGGPISGSVTLKDSSPSTSTLTASSASDGSFSFDVTGLTAPFLLRIAYGDAASPSTLYSLAAGAGTTNITPLTSIATRAAAGGVDLDAFFRNSTGADIAGAGSRMSQAVSALQSVLSPLFQRFNVQGNLLSTPFTADHTGIDAVMDAITVDFKGVSVSLAAKSSGMLLFSAPPANPGAGNFDVANLDQMNAPVPAPGGSLYTLYCAGCHGALPDSTKKGITIARLQAAITSDAGGMQWLSQLSASEMQSIVTALASGSTTPPPASASPDGAALYTSNCADCHGALATSAKLGASSVRIQNAISGGVGAMGRLASLTAADIQAIAVALAAQGPVPPSTPTATLPDGSALYASTCAGCHGPLGSSTKQGVSIARLQGAISNNIGAMGTLSTLSVSEVQAIVTALTPGTPTPTPTPPPTTLDGTALYTSSCAGCHGPLASSTKAGATVTRIQNAIASNTAGMGVLSILSAGEVQAIATALSSVSPPPPPTTGTLDGPALYAQYCASCHGALATSTKGRASVSSIQAAIAANTGGMGSLAGLTSSDITLIAAELALISPTTVACGTCHAIPPPVGQHAEHSRFSCANCHGVGYGTTTVSAATHNNGVVNLATSIGWVASTKTCANGCHGTERWLESDD